MVQNIFSLLLESCICPYQVCLGRQKGASPSSLVLLSPLPLHLRPSVSPSPLCSLRVLLLPSFCSWLTVRYSIQSSPKWKSLSYYFWMLAEQYTYDVSFNPHYSPVGEYFVLISQIRKWRVREVPLLGGGESGFEPSFIWLPALGLSHIFVVLCHFASPCP